MKTLLKLPLFLFLFSGLLAISQEKPIIFASTSDPVTGLSAYSPIVIHTPYKHQTRKKAEYFFTGLRTRNGEKLQVTAIKDVPNPNFKKPKILLHNYITGEVINKGNGKFLKKVTLKSEESGEIYELFINTNIKDELLVPQPFLFEIPGGSIGFN
ncbi:MAG: hypothetical protein ABJ092_14485 [Gillisia sp.]